VRILLKFGEQEFAADIERKFNQRQQGGHPSSGI
jgi:hypothetical protein